MPRIRTALALSAVLVVAGCGASGSGSPSSFKAQALAGHAAAPAAPGAWTAWPQALYDAQHSGAAPVVGPQSSRIRWTRKLEGDVTPGPVVAADGTIYAASNGGVLHALDPATGADKWTVDEHASYGSDQSTSPAVLPDGLILWPGPGGKLIAVDPSGHVRWRLDLGGQPTSPAVLPNGTVAVGNTSGLVAVLKPAPAGPGTVTRTDLAEASYGSVVWSADGRTVYDTVASGVAAIRSGAVVWQAKVGKTIEVSPAVAPAGTIVIGTNDPYEYGLDPTNGSVRWRYERPRVTYSSPVVTHDGIAYFGDHGNRVIGLDAATGKRVFGYEGDQNHPGSGGIGIWTSIAVDSQHTVYAGTRQGLIYAVNRDGKKLWSYAAGATVDSYPALTGDGALVIGVSDGRLIAFGSR